MSAEEARQLAESWLRASDEERAAAQQAVTKLNRIVALTAADPARLDDILRRLRDEARADPEVISLVAGYLAGIRASRSRGE